MSRDKMPALANLVVFSTDRPELAEEAIGIEACRAMERRMHRLDVARMGPSTWTAAANRLLGEVPSAGWFTLHCPVGAVSVQSDERIAEGVVCMGRGVVV